MKPQEAIGIMKIAIAEVEWEYPMDYPVAFEEAIKALEKQMYNCEECKHANYYDWCTLGNHLVLCREHNAIMRGDNCCRDWTPLER